MALHPDDASTDAALVEAAHGAGLACNGVWTVDEPGGCELKASGVGEMASSRTCLRRPGGRSATMAHVPVAAAPSGHDDVNVGHVAEPQLVHLAEVVAVDLVRERAVAASTVTVV
ncbi:MAG: hypothetical protein R2699_18080 [Acidimicrobiales bacterium]